MKQAHFTKSTFRRVYISIAIICLAMMIGAISITRGLIARNLVDGRLNSIESVIRTQGQNILLHHTRPLRDELLKSKAISDDRDFEHFLSSDFSKLPALIKDCRAVSGSICVGRNYALFTSAPTIELSNYAVLLKGNFSTPGTLFLWEALILSLIFSAMAGLAHTIRQKENALIEKVAASLKTVRDIAEVFTDAPETTALDEYGAITQSFSDLGEKLKKSLDEIRQYKLKFERDTRLNQLALILSQVSHDLKAPFNEMENFLQNLPFLLKSTSKDEFETIRGSLVTRIRFGKDVLAQAFNSTKRATVAREVISLKRIISNTAHRARQRQALKSAHIETNILGDYQFLGDQFRFETALMNLIDNSVEEKPDTLIKISAEKEGADTLKISFEDNGPGIPAEALDTIFEPLVSYKAGGTGLGLSSTKDILAQHGGTIKAVPSRGAKFELRIPIHEVNHA